ncbi:TolC family protein [Pseudolysobacter antarcticus]|uniref:TolC family protein n=1 Tax=Pseudolysobacter antarcticus TaxID=2511995 RepID=A0A411HGI0_9GAMM|nr:TolC family protein [Pseudolysobacter antarcticus]QBB69554.1 TolC family protein [Pseudolysobacter antarcticus]
MHIFLHQFADNAAFNLRRLLCAALLACSVMTGCARYVDKPIDAHASSLLAPLDPQQISADTKAHPSTLLPVLDIDPTGPWNDMQIGLIAVLTNPGLKAARAQGGIAEAQVFAAGLLPDLQIGISADHPDSVGVVNAYGISAGFDIAALLLHSATRAKAKAAAAEVQKNIAWQEWTVANQARLLARRLPFLQQQQALATDAENTAQNLLGLTTQNVDAGNAKLDDLALRRVALLDTTERAHTLARDIETTRLSLNQTLGATPEQRLPFAAKSIARDFSTLDANSLFETARSERLDLRALRDGYQSQQAETRHAILAQYPMPVLTLNRARDTTPIYSKGASVALTLPLWNRNRGAIAVAEATREQLRIEYESRLHETRAEIATQLTELQRIATQSELLRQQLQQMQPEIQALNNAVQRGDVALVTYETARAAHLDKQIAALALAQAAAEGEVTLELTVGVLLWQ